MLRVCVIICTKNIYIEYLFNVLNIYTISTCIYIYDAQFYVHLCEWFVNYHLFMNVFIRMLVFVLHGTCMNVFLR